VRLSLSYFISDFTAVRSDFISDFTAFRSNFIKACAILSHFHSKDATNMVSDLRDMHCQRIIVLSQLDGNICDDTETSAINPSISLPLQGSQLGQKALAELTNPALDQRIIAP
jgi:hypothetical protein